MFGVHVDECCSYFSECSKIFGMSSAFSNKNFDHEGTAIKKIVVYLNLYLKFRQRQDPPVIKATKIIRSDVEKVWQGGLRAPNCGYQPVGRCG